MQKRALGKGLEALLPESFVKKSQIGIIQEIELDRIIPNRYQPRHEGSGGFDQEGLKALAESIKSRGVVAPILVRRLDGERYELIAGERRWRAAGLAGQTRIPAIVREASGPEPLELALIENLLRKDLNPLETARAYRQLVEEFEISQDDLSQITGKDRSSVANYLRLLNLPEPVQAYLLDERITLGHAKALLSLERASDQVQIARRVVAEKLSVRETERLAGRPGRGSGRRPRVGLQTPEVSHLQERLSYCLGTKVRVAGGPKRGKIVIEYYTAEDLDRISEIILQ